MDKITLLANDIQEVMHLEELEETSIDDVTVHRWLKESKRDFHTYQERYKQSGSRQDKFDLLLKYLEVAAWQAKKRNMKKGT